MPPIGSPSTGPNLLRRWYWLLSILVTLCVWAGVTLAMRPLTDTDGSHASYPYGLITDLENKALDLLFQLRDVRQPNLASRGMREPITIIEIDEESIRASKVRLHHCSNSRRPLL